MKRRDILKLFCISPIVPALTKLDDKELKDHKLIKTNRMSKRKYYYFAFCLTTVEEIQDCNGNTDKLTKLLKSETVRKRVQQHFPERILPCLK